MLNWYLKYFSNALTSHGVMLHMDVLKFAVTGHFKKENEYKRRYSLPDKVFGLRYQSPPFDNVRNVRLTLVGSFYPCQKHYLKVYG